MTLSRSLRPMIWDSVHAVNRRYFDARSAQWCRKLDEGNCIAVEGEICFVFGIAVEQPVGIFSRSVERIFVEAPHSCVRRKGDSTRRVGDIGKKKPAAQTGLAGDADQRSEKPRQSIDGAHQQFRIWPG